MIVHPGQPVANIPIQGSGTVESSNVLVTGFNAGTPEVQSVVSVAFASTAQADYFVFSRLSDGDTFAVWLDKDDAGTAPSGAAYVASDNQIEVDIATGDTAAQVAAKVKAAIELDAQFQISDITLSIVSATVSFTHALPGDVAAPARHNADDSGNGSFVVATTTPGVAHGLQSKYFLVSSSLTDYYIWFNVNNQGVDPAVGGRTGVEVALVGNETGSQIAATVVSDVSISGLVFSNDGSTVQVSATASASITDASGGDSGLTVTVGSQGVASSNQVPSPAQSPGTISNSPSII